MVLNEKTRPRLVTEINFSVPCFFGSVYRLVEGTSGILSCRVYVMGKRMIDYYLLNSFFDLR